MPRPMFSGNVNPTPEWTDCCWPHCDRLAEGGGPPLCTAHFRRVGTEWISYMQGRSRDYLPMEPWRRAEPGGPTLEEHLDDRAKKMAAQSQVYYVRIGDHIKIGYTINMRQRMGALRVTEDAVLATEPGGRELERRRHEQFAAERVGRREDFNPSRRLLAWVETVKAENGPPLITTYKTALAT